jgi:hypothetical protein
MNHRNGLRETDWLKRTAQTITDRQNRTDPAGAARLAFRMLPVRYQVRTVGTVLVRVVGSDGSTWSCRRAFAMLLSKRRRDFGTTVVPGPVQY